MTPAELRGDVPLAVYIELDLTSVVGVAALVDGVGGDGSAFRVWIVETGPGAAAALADALRERGLSGVPCFVVEDEVFIGRQHGSMIRWILAGRSGVCPA